MDAPFAWPWTLESPVRFCDLDAMGHVNNAVYLTYLEQARNECYLALTGRSDILGPDGGLDFVVARMEIDYRLPVRYGDAVSVSLRPVAVGRSSFTLEYEGRDRAGRRVLRARRVQVAYAWDASASKRIDPAVADALRSGLPGGSG